MMYKVDKSGLLIFLSIQKLLLLVYKDSCFAARWFIMLACVSCYMTSLLLAIRISFLVMGLRILQVSLTRNSALVIHGMAHGDLSPGVVNR